MSREIIIGNLEKNRGVLVSDIQESERRNKEIIKTLDNKNELIVYCHNLQLYIDEEERFMFYADVANGVFSFSTKNKFWLTRSQHIYPSKLLAYCLETWNQHIEAAKGSWTLGHSINAKVYKAERRRWKSPIEAAKETWTGRQFTALGFSSLVKIVEYPTWIFALFERESDKPLEFTTYW